MSWLITLLVLAVAAFFVVKMMKSNTQKQQAEHEQQQRQRLDGVAAPDGSPSASQKGHAGAAPNDTPESPLETTAAKAAAAAGVTAAGTAAAGMAAAGTAAAMGASSNGASTSSAADSRLASGDTLTDVREMIKILNLDGPTLPDSRFNATSSSPCEKEMLTVSRMLQLWTQWHRSYAKCLPDFNHE